MNSGQQQTGGGGGEWSGVLNNLFNNAAGVFSARYQSEQALQQQRVSADRDVGITRANAAAGDNLVKYISYTILGVAGIWAFVRLTR